MWIFLPFGFFSIVQANPKELMVRARARKDLEELCEQLNEHDEQCHPRWVSTPDADYPFRIIVEREPFSSWLAQVALTIDYSNFKNEVAKFDRPRESVYHDVWAILRRHLDERLAGGVKGRRRG